MTADTMPCRKCGCYWEACDCYIVTDSVIYIHDMIGMFQASLMGPIRLWTCEFCGADEWLETVVDGEIRTCKVCNRPAKFVD